jgi:hypothetical protein
MRVRFHEPTARMQTNRLAFVLLSAAGFALTACALDASTEPVATGSEPVYKTGSNIATHRTGRAADGSTGSDGVTSVSGEEAARVMRVPTMPQPMPGGAH